MRLLLDTHAFLWSYSAKQRLTSRVRNAIEDRSNEVLVSAITFWEIAIKMRLGKLDAIGSHPSDLVAIAEELGFTPVSMSPTVAASYGSLVESTHTDPFDRMLAWQAISLNCALVSRDPAFKLFKADGLHVLWK